MHSTVVICAHTMDRLELTVRSVGSVLAGSTRPDEVIVVVDTNVRLLQALANRLEDPTVAVVPNPGKGVAAARTFGAVLASGEVLAFLDDDAWAEPHWLEALLSVFRDPSVVGAGGCIRPEWAKGCHHLPEELLWIVGATYLGHRTGPGPISRPIGANMAARRSALLAVGGFPAAFGPRGGKKSSSNEELATYGKLTRVYGSGSVRYVPDAVVHHFVPPSRTTLSYVLTRSAAEGRSKADVRAVHGANAMRDDNHYVLSVLLPGILRYLRKQLRSRSLDATWCASACTLSLVMASVAYVARRGRHLVQPRRTPVAEAEREVSN
jgi:glucosyl-dolichyl phosphate glucuronosyltransferase